MPNQSDTLRRTAVVLWCAGYALVSGWFMLRHVVGDSHSRPSAYFFTWDMFPGYVTESSRRMVVGFTQQGRLIKLLPATNHHFRWGIDNTVTRWDIDRRWELLRPTVEHRIREYNALHPGDAIETVLLVERYWPSKFNLPDDLYRATYGTENPHRRYWRRGPSWLIDEQGHIDGGEGE